MQAGNQNASPPYVLSQIEKASASATEFSTAFNNFIADGPNSTHAEIIRTVSIFSGSISDVLSNTKGLTRFANDDRSADQLINSARKSAQATVWFFRGLQSFRLEGLEPLQKTDVVINNNLEVQQDLQSLSKLVDTFAPKGTKISTKGDLSEMVDQELSKAADAIDAAAQRLAKLKKKPREGYTTYELRIHDSIVEAALAVTNAIAELIKAATATQEEIVREGRGSSSRTAFYKKNNRWTEGLISAAKAVASSTNTLIETADGVISGRNSPEQLIVASNDVAASTAQLVAASRVKASFMSKTQDRLETASKAVGAACRALVRQVQDIIAERNRDEGETVDYSKLSSHEFKVREMEQQVGLFSALSFFLFLHADFSLFPNRSKFSSSRTTWRVRGNGWERCARSRTRKTEVRMGWWKVRPVGTFVSVLLGCVFVALCMVHGCFVSIDLHRGSTRNSTCHLYFTFLLWTRGRLGNLCSVPGMPWCVVLGIYVGCGKRAANLTVFVSRRGMALTAGISLDRCTGSVWLGRFVSLFRIYLAAVLREPYFFLSRTTGRVYAAPDC